MRAMERTTPGLQTRRKDSRDIQKRKINFFLFSLVVLAPKV